jgi:lipopolysaccharide transport system permease protein
MDNSPPRRRVIIKAGHMEQRYWKDLWAYRELCYFLSWRDIIVRYRQTVLGVAWVLIRPLLIMMILTMIFSRIAGLPSGGIPYPLLVLVGLLPWQFFSAAIADAANSLVSNSNLIGKVYFPRLLVPASTIVTALVDMMVSLALLAVLLVYYTHAPTWRLLALPFFIMLSFAAALGFGLWLAALNVKYRDFRNIVPFIVQFGLYVSPVGFSTNAIPEAYRMLIFLNPMSGVIEGFRWAILETPFAFQGAGLLISILLIALLLFAGISFFRKTEKSFADII